ncbi:uncharacterized protein LOC110665877 isoform X2 [Hevea brasiliensis]|uniref:uncharacterized protein LOC110665877 isoform X2 n=1 Tax=Hevea brasiliensis TaxID=3981 RepID=UPI0025F3C3B2|nr:uncharacterized protein LOC110665877 isoform X2 [Hevea brasiliensis]
MGSYIEEEEERFFDSCEEIYSVSDWGSNYSYDDCSSSVEFDNSFSQYEVWIKTPESVQNRRNRFLNWMGVTLDQNTIAQEESPDQSSTKIQLGIDRMVDTSGAVLRMSGFEDDQSSMSSHSIETWDEFETNMENTSVYETRKLDDGKEFVVDEIDQNGMLSRLHELCANRSLSFEEFQRITGISPLIQRLTNKYVRDARVMTEAKKKAKSWLRRLGRLSHAGQIADRHGLAPLKPNEYESTVGSKMQRIKVHPSKKRSKELSSLYARQEFLAHNGSILTMKFSHDGQYLASGGEDGVVRVWRVIEDDRLDQFHISANDPSCLYFTMNHLSKIASLDADEMKIDKTKRQISSDSTCVIFPPKIFRVLEKPLHEFQGHSVTCVDFNPLNDNYFISGSIDGKVRIWEVLGCQVVDYTVIREIVTAVSFRPDGKGGIVGTLTGNCLFYDIIDNRLQLDAQISLQGKKKLTGRRITGFEFSPSDPTKVVVSSADSIVRVLNGMDVICKFRVSSIGIAANQMSASFTTDGKHVVSTSEDSNVYIWNYNNQEKSASQAKNIHSYESFKSQNVSIAIPWGGIENGPGALVSPTPGRDMHGSSEKNGHVCHKYFGKLDHKILQPSSDCFSLTRGFLLDSLTRGSATWPEEKLTDSSPVAMSPTKSKSEFKFLKSACQNILSSPHLWGLVIVTAGWDGRIRTYLNYGLPLRI